MTESSKPSGPGVHYRWNAPTPLGYGPSDSVALFVAAPLLTAAALSLAGVVGGADDHFRWPGPILLLLVVSSLVLTASIQLGYHSRLYLYSYTDIVDWLSEEYVRTRKVSLWRQQKEDQAKWLRYSRKAVWCFNLGTLLLGFGVAAALAPPDGGMQGPWRWTASAVTLAATLADGVWIVVLRGRAARTPLRVSLRGFVNRFTNRGR